MPKASRVGTFRRSAAASTKNAVAATVVDKDKEENKQLSRGQRKRMAKREQYIQKERMIMSSLRLKRVGEQAKRIDGLDTIKEALQSVEKGVTWRAEEDITKKTNSMLASRKSRKKLLEKEAAHVSLVKQHPAFQADPFATLREHLTNTLAKDMAKQKKEAVEHENHRIADDEKKKAMKKEAPYKKKKSKFRATRSRGK